MASVNDLWKEFFQAAGVTGSYQFNDALKQFFYLHGFNVNKSVQDLWKDFFVFHNISTNQSVDDMWKAYLSLQNITVAGSGGKNKWLANLYSPFALFTGSGVNYAWLDAQDMSTMYQDAAGTTPVTAVEQPVGLHLDKSRGLQLGPELVTNGDFSSDTTGWQVYSGASLSVVGGRGVITTTSATPSGMYVTIQTVAGQYYKASLGYMTGSSSDVRLRINDGSVPVSTSIYDLTAPGQCVFKAQSSTTTIYMRANYIGTATFDDISVKALPGYHATQPITASRPTLSARYNLLTKTEDFADAAWQKLAFGTALAPVITPSYIPAPFGGGVASRCVMNLNGGTTLSDQSQLAHTAVVPAYNCVGSIWVKSNTQDTYSIGIRANLGYAIKTVTPEWSRIEFSNQESSTSESLRIYLRGGQGTSSYADISIYAAQQVTGSSAGTYQRVNTATDYDSNPLLFPWYMKYDGIDDYMNLPYMGLYASGAASVVAAISQFGPDGVFERIISETKADSANQRYIPVRGALGLSGYDFNIINDAGALVFDSADISITLGTQNLISVIDSGNIVNLYKSSSLQSAENYTRTGTLTLDSTTIGAQKVSSTVNAFANMYLYGLVITKTALTDVQRKYCEQYLAKKSGVTL